MTLAVLATKHTAEAVNVTLDNAAVDFGDVLLVTTAPMAFLFLTDPRIDRIAIIPADDMTGLDEQVAARSCAYPWVFTFQAGETLPKGMKQILGRALHDAELSQAGTIAICSAPGHAVVRMRSRERWLTGRMLMIDDSYLIPSVGPLTKAPAQEPVGVAG